MYLSHMPLNPQRRSTRELIASPQRLHAAVLSGFLPGASERGRVLWRLDSDGAHELNLMVVSAEVPSFDALVEQAGWTANPVWRTADYEPFLARVTEGQRWVFRLVANPVKSVRSVDELQAERPLPRGSRVPLIKRDDQEAWLLARSELAGFAISPGASGGLNLRIMQSSRRSFERRSDGQRRTVTLQTVQYDGVLQVSDARRLRRTLVEGLGSAKGYGCGLLTLAPER